MQTAQESNVLALDVGHVRIGVAYASGVAKIPRPHKTIQMSESAAREIADLVQTEEIGTLVVGLPRGLSGQETDQTKYVRDFVEQIRAVTDVPIVLQDEALTSKRAEAELKQRNKRGPAPTIDELAATYILEDYLGIQSEHFA